ncbi:MAG: hypothetical protein ACI94Y_000781 [Maribacter sp.]|jgi:hypothetical protein
MYENYYSIAYKSIKIIIMKKSIILLLACIMLSTTVIFAQKKAKKKQSDKKFKWGVNAGMSTSSVKPDDLVITNREDANSFLLNVKDAKYGIDIGAFAHFKTGKRFFIRPELHINSTRTDYELQDLRTANPVKNLVTESYHNITMPVNLGIQFGPLRIQAGAVGAFHIGGKSGLEQSVDEYSQKFDGLALGWQAGIGLDIWRFNVDLKYEGDFGRYGEHMEFFGNNIAFNDREKQMKFAIGWTF